MGKFYITTTLPYVNAKPHVGFAMEIVRADVLARTHKLLGDEVFFNTGTDEHGQKIYQKAVEEGKDPKEYCDEYAKKFGVLKEKLNLSYNNFVRTTDENHIEAAKEFWRRCYESGDIEKRNYKIKYCIGCELEKTDSELVEGRCPVHPNKELEVREEENYFFRFSKYQDKLLELYKTRPNFVIPSFREEEMIAFVGGGLQDFSISRLKSKMPWGIEVPGDSEHVMYVWFDALVNYISVLGWPKDEKKFGEFWPGLQVAGKDNLRQQSAMWQAMLMSAGIPNSRQIYVEGFINSGGQKMSKSLGNVIDPIEYVEKYGTDALRYFLLAKLDPFEDGDFTKERFEEAYQSDLANGLSNLCARVTTMAEKSGFEFETREYNFADVFFENIRTNLDNFRFNSAIGEVWSMISDTDQQIDEQKPWKLSGDQLKDCLSKLLDRIRRIQAGLLPILPETSTKIGMMFRENKVVRGENLFNRL